MAIQSFSAWGVNKIFSSDILYPTNCTTLRKIPQKRSIRESIESNEIDIFARKHIKPTLGNSLIKPVRCVARGIAAIAVGIILSPLGVVYHAGAMSLHALSLPTNFLNPRAYRL